MPEVLGVLAAVERVDSISESATKTDHGGSYPSRAVADLVVDGLGCTTLSSAPANCGIDRASAQAD